MDHYYVLLFFIRNSFNLIRASAAEKLPFKDYLSAVVDKALEHGMIRDDEAEYLTAVITSELGELF